MNKIDFSFIKYSDGTYGRVQGRRNEAWKLASRLTGKPINEVTQIEAGQAYSIVAIGETDRVTCNNWRRLHGLPMKRRRDREKV